MKNSFLKLIIFVLFAVLLFSCAATPKFTSNDPPVIKKRTAQKPKQKPTNKTRRDELPEQSDVYYNLSESLETDIGFASYYSTDFDGKQTANGEVYNMYELTAAHKSYPFNTLIRVTNLSNNKSTIVRINDRGPFVGDRIIDLSLGAALQLDMVDAGVQEVQLDIIEWGE